MIMARKRLVVALGILQVFVGIGAVPAGLLLILDPSGGRLGMSAEMLAGSLFPDFLVPGLFLLLVNGLGNLAGAVLTFGRRPFAGLLAVLLGAFLMAWITVQVEVLGLPVHWLQALYFALGVVEWSLGWRIEPDFLRKLRELRSLQT